jgi:hypothetical protein
MTTVKKSTVLLASAVAAALMLVAGSRSANAFPAFSQKEKKPCSYCHVKQTGGGPRTAAGNWYKTHGLSLAGFKPVGGAPAAKPGTKPASKPAAKPAPKKPAAKKPAPKKPAPKKKG